MKKKDGTIKVRACVRACVRPLPSVSQPVSQSVSQVRLSANQAVSVSLVEVLATFLPSSGVTSAQHWS
jgi:hypothetical protein